MAALGGSCAKNRRPFDYDTSVEGMRAAFRPRGRRGLRRRHREPPGRHTGPFLLARTEAVFSIGSLTGSLLIARRTTMDNRLLARASVGLGIASLDEKIDVDLIDRVEVSIIEETQPRWLAFLNKQLDLLERLPWDFMNIAAPNGALAPHLAPERADVANPQCRRDLHVFQHAGPSRWRLRTREGCPAQGHGPSDQHRPGNSPVLARAPCRRSQG